MKRLQEILQDQRACTIVHKMPEKRAEPPEPVQNLYCNPMYEPISLLKEPLLTLRLQHISLKSALYIDQISFINENLIK